MVGTTALTLSFSLLKCGISVKICTAPFRALRKDADREDDSEMVMKVKDPEYTETVKEWLQQNVPKEHYKLFAKVETQSAVLPADN